MIDIQVSDPVSPVLNDALSKIDSVLGDVSQTALVNLVLPVEGVQIYPPAPPHAYRTGNYGSGFYVEVDGPGAYISNPTPYGGYVGGDDQTQAAAAIGWKQVADVVEEHADEIGLMMQEAVINLLE